jgi:magnesium chelatase family protein
MAEVRGHAGVKRALEVAAAGGHHVLMAGPPGSGKTMLARRMAGILPALSPEEALEVTAVHSVAGLLPPGEALVRGRPFRAPHHTISTAGLAGGGSPTRPGEVSLAHQGVLFLDELPEYTRSALETLRQPLEDGWISIVRVRDRVRFPARFTLVAAMNPCPCGHLGDPRRACTCDPTQVARYRARVSGPLRDRIDLHLFVPAIPWAELAGRSRGATSLEIRQRVTRAWERQRARNGGRRGDGRVRPPTLNAALTPSGTARWCRLDSEGRRLMEDAVDRLGLSARGAHRILRVARTIADLEEGGQIREEHLAEAIQYRG